MLSSPGGADHIRIVVPTHDAVRAGMDCLETMVEASTSSCKAVEVWGRKPQEAVDTPALSPRS